MTFYENLGVWHQALHGWARWAHPFGLGQHDQISVGTWKNSSRSQTCRVISSQLLDRTPEEFVYDTLKHQVYFIMKKAQTSQLPGPRIIKAPPKWGICKSSVSLWKIKTCASICWGFACEGQSPKYGSPFIIVRQSPNVFFIELLLSSTSCHW